MKKRGGKLFLFCLLLMEMASIPSTFGADDPGTFEFREEVFQNPGKGEAGELLLFIHSADLMCFNCLEGILDFLRSLPSHVQQARVRGVLVPRKSDHGRSAADSSRIQLKKIRGFIAAHHLHFRVVLDSSAVFSSVVSEGSSLIAIDGSRGECVGYDFPLSQKEKQVIWSLLGLSKGPSREEH